MTFHVSHFKSIIYIHILHFTLYILLCEVYRADGVDGPQEMGRN